MKHIKVLFVFICIITICFINIFNFKIYAHSTNLGIDGYEGITYDPCKPYNQYTTDTVDSYGEKWYTLNAERRGINQISHIDDDIFTVYYKIYDDGDQTDESWVNNYETYKRAVKLGITDWNYVGAYETDVNGVIQIIPVVNFVDVDTLEDPDSVYVNLEIHMNDNTDFGISGEIDPFYDTEVISDTQVYGGITHYHYTKYKIICYPHQYPDFLSMFQDMIRTGAHEAGHLLGLTDIDQLEVYPEIGYHHQELLMGYPLGQTEATSNITYNDLAGVLITRGIHTNDEHKWLYDECSSTINSHKLICSICNCVKYVESLEGYEFLIYKACDNNHTVESGNMMPVARFYNSDYIKCKFCRYVECFDRSVFHEYIYMGTCNEETHLAYNTVGGITYLIEEPHRYSVEIGGGKNKCYLCPKCDDGSMYIDIQDNYILQCYMPNVVDSFELEAGESKVFRLDSLCKNTFSISTGSTSKVLIELFDKDMNLLDIVPAYSDDKSLALISNQFFINTYYVRFRFEDVFCSGNISYQIRSDNTHCQTSINVLEEEDALKHLHNSHAEYVFYNTEAKFVEIKLSITLDEGEYTYPSGMISVNDENGNIVNKIYDLDDNLAISKAGEQSIYIFFDFSETYIINLNFDSDNVVEAILSLETPDIVNYDSFVNEEITFENMTSGTTDNFVRIHTGQAGLYRMTLNFTGDTVSDLTLILIRRGMSEDNIGYTHVSDETFDVSSNNSIYLEAHYTPSEICYIGYLGGNVEGYVEVKFERIISDVNTPFLIDPGYGYNSGTEVTLNSGACGSNVITEGHTRLVYFDGTAPSFSRLDYYWYSSNEDLLTVSEFGTLLAQKVETSDTVSICAVYKYDFTKVYIMDINVVNDTKDELVYILYENIQIALGSVYAIQSDSRWPSKILQNYTWSIDNSNIAIVDIWGRIRPQNVGTTVVRGNYKLNERYIVLVYINVVLSD